VFARKQLVVTEKIFCVQYTSKVVNQVGCADPDPEVELDCLRGLPWQALRYFSSIPCVDGVLIEQEPGAMWLSGDYNRDVSIMVGSVIEEVRV
jgi:hypothetical protein